jgi:hypothetical protein
MYESIFINGSGSNIFATLGALDKLKSQVENITIWNVNGNASLILFYKLLGLTPKQTFEKLKNFDIINSFINGHSLFPEDEDEKKEYIKGFLEKSFKGTLFNSDVTLDGINSLTGIKPCFIVWNRTEQKIVNLNAKDNPRMKLLDCVLASLTNIGVYNTYEIDEDIYSSLENIECFPVSFSYYTSVENLFYLVNITDYNKKYSLGINLGPLKDTEDEFLTQKGEYHKYRIENSCKALPNNKNICKLYSVFSRGNSKEEEKASLFILGHRQADGFNSGKDTRRVYKKYLEDIYQQN